MACTDMQDAGASAVEVMAQGRWRSDTWRVYSRRSKQSSTSESVEPEDGSDLWTHEWLRMQQRSGEEALAAMVNDELDIYEL